MSWDNILEDLARSSPGQLLRGSFRSRIRPRPQNSHDSLTPVRLHTCEQTGPNGGVFGEEPQGPWPIIRRLRTIARSSALATLILGSMSFWGQRAAAEESSGEPECEHAAPGETKVFRGVVSNASGAGISGAVTRGCWGSDQQMCTKAKGGAHNSTLAAS